ncbi:polysaccharide pyruvyl transferase family protein [Enterobacter hormaechei]|uniref:polysaccharide pyruvyl transferase family protein n=2 Tax=Enterobacter hormaechei TaxID=158836 RepID=UPI0023E3BC6C|nr:polysaccharide pyruvyl transferase family protein [Enterobacter hormaechei]MCE1439273.1 polysaccharide pyruvyl transferase family protein [Enterobacter hormaechei]MDF3564391.1 polysaccharide pyruvyl transferase family protein [Enterobacter hormaechei]MEB6525086.1 polysaccharide pyruvyl transferase family protein [Enterobacter hormaechei]HBM2772802.1 polysaccharide pyruvyl transferase family protein [Enterobacter hormaechei subsp. xiangfangensis]
MNKIQKIGIINFQYSDHNYGAVLQAAALEKVLERKGFSVKHIDFISTPEKIISPIVIAKKILKRIGLTTIIKKILGRKILIKHDVSNQEAFENFRKRWINRTKRFDTFESLKNEPLDFDAVIVGSDQVWRPTMYNRRNDYKVYFLSFLKKGCKKISYAASFGVDYWEVKDEIVTSEIADMVRGFDAISVREKSGISICKNIFLADSTHVLDPTLLAGKGIFDEIIASYNEIDVTCKQIVYYKLDVDDIFLSNIQQFSAYKNKKVTNIYYNKVETGYAYYSVGQWLSNIRESEIVITDSFHCVCFCILFHKDFICCINESRGLSRLKSLLMMLGIEDRICSSDDDFINKYNNLRPIDYSVVDNILLKQRILSEEFLMNSLSD